MDSLFNHYFRSYFDDTETKSQKAHELATEWRKAFYENDTKFIKALRAIKMHPESYGMGYSLTPEAYYEHEIARAKYEIGLELKQILKSSQPGKIQLAFQRLAKIERDIKTNNFVI